MADGKRFTKTYSQGVPDVAEIRAGRERGVHGLFHAGGHCGGMPPLPNRDGAPAAAWVYDEDAG